MEIKATTLVSICEGEKQVEYIAIRQVKSP